MNDRLPEVGANLTGQRRPPHRSILAFAPSATIASPSVPRCRQNYACSATVLARRYKLPSLDFGGRRDSVGGLQRPAGDAFAKYRGVGLRSLRTMAEASDSESAEEEAVAGPSGIHSMAEASDMESGVEEAVAGPSEVQPTQADLEPEPSVVGTGSGPGVQAIPEESAPGMETATPKLLPDPSSVFPQYPVVQSGGQPISSYTPRVT
uniref:Uncharacterized protein n=1 Tax=Sphaerodactylus townsendi TaxID=933632 RepID=A0ACB8G5J1_9SAUR